MEIEEHIDAIDERGRLLAAAARTAGLGAAVPPCPEWAVRDLVAHQGGVHRWANWHVAQRSPTICSEAATERLFTAPGDAGLLDWFEDGHATLVATLRAADPTADVWSFLPAPSGVAFWARRQAHETTIHSVDAEAAAGRLTPVPAALAVDGIDELLLAFLARRRGALVADPPVALAVVAADTGDAWTIRIEPERRVPTRGLEPADCTITGPADVLYRFLWNRADRSELDAAGDTTVLDLWSERAHITWS